ncbi:excisionase family DNA-binding protein [Deinococcus phoenicis]|uniref:excisionase family DNA-binding protein n=1 Tax=Deinococcus phoenicis TaxID=1476583 RepID=UPI0009DD8878
MTNTNTARKEKAWLSVTEAAEHMNITSEHIREAVRKGKLRALNVSAGERPLYRIKLTDLENWRAADEQSSPQHCVGGQR